MNQKLSEITIPGNAIASSIKMMAALGPIGERVLREQGIDKIDPEKRYSFKIRTAMFDEVCTRFGNDALTAFGFENYRHYPEFIGFARDFRKKHGHRLTDPNNYTENIKLLEELMVSMGQMLDGVISRNFKSEEASGYVEFKKISPAVFNIDTKTAVKKDHAPFIRGAWLAMMMECISDIYEIDFEFMSDKSKTLENGWGVLIYTVRFTPHAVLQNCNELVARERFNANEALLRSVLIDAERQKEQIERLSLQLGKYLPPQIHRALFSGNYDPGITTRRKKLTIFFSDIKNFTSTSEGLQPEDLTNYLNEYFSEMTAIALDHGATIDKYIGDAMMVFFGDPDSKGEKDDARSCISMALNMQDRMIELQAKWRNQGFADPFQVRMGMNTGYCNVGNFGSDQRLTYTIIGGEVNVAQRLESAADAGGILMSYETYAHAQDMVNVKELESITMKGIQREIKVYSVLERKTSLNIKETSSSGEKSVKIKGTKAPSLENRLMALETEMKQIRKLINDMTKNG